MKTLRCKLQKQLNVLIWELYVHVSVCVWVLYCTFINNQRTRVFQSWIFPLPPPCSSVKKCKQISWMFFIVIYLFHVIFFLFILVFFHFSFFFFFVQRDIGDCAECRCRVWQLFHVCYLSVRVCVCERVNEPVCECVCVWVCQLCLCETNSFCGLH